MQLDPVRGVVFMDTTRASGSDRDELNAGERGLFRRATRYFKGTCTLPNSPRLEYLAVCTCDPRVPWKNGPHYSTNDQDACEVPRLPDLAS